MPKFPALILLLTSLILMNACVQAKFRGSSHEKKPRPLCTEVEAIDGLNVAFLIDNSYSNALTDCPNPKNTPTQDGPNSPQVECQDTTNRERAVLSAHDFIGGFKSHPNRKPSSMAIASFPTSADIHQGWEIRSADWLAIAPEKREEVSGSLAFTRQPIGATPYNAAMEAGLKLFEMLGKRDGEWLAFLVTDGEPTDEDAASAAANGKRLRDLGVNMVTVFVTGKDTRDTRQARHVQYLQAQRHSQENIDALMGLNGKRSLVDEISTTKIEVQDASQLEGVFKDVIKQTVDCE